MTLKNETLMEIAPQIKIYLTEVACLISSTSPDERSTFDFTAQNRLAIAQTAVAEVRQKYELPEITDADVLTFGVTELARTFTLFNGSTDRRDNDLAATVETAITEILRSDTRITLPGLLAQARAYPPPKQYN